MNMFEEAAALKGTMQMCALSQSEMAKKLGVSQSYVANKLRLLALDEKTRERIISAQLTERHARALLRLLGRPELETALERMIGEGLSVQRSEALVDLLHEESVPEIIGRQDRYRGIEMFKDSLERSLRTLTCMGVDVRRTTSYHGARIYITVSIDETGD